MQYRQLGKSSLRISETGFGGMSLEENNAGIKDLLHKAVEWGINFFDTADLYQKGWNEEMIGAALHEKRNQVLIATKVGNQWKPDGSGWEWNPSKTYILAAAEKSLQRLQTDHIDLYQLHGGTLEDPIDEIIEAFELLQQQGKIRYYGISSIRPNVIREYVKRSRIASVMMQYGLLDRRPEEECLSLLQQHHIGVLARGSLAKGLLAGKPAAAFLNYTTEDVAHAAHAIKKISGNGRTASQTAIRFVLQHPAVISAIVGIRTEQQLEDAVDTVKSPALTEDDRKMLSSSIPLNYYDSNR